MVVLTVHNVCVRVVSVIDTRVLGQVVVVPTLSVVGHTVMLTTVCERGAIGFSNGGHCMTGGGIGEGKEKMKGVWKYEREKSVAL